MARVVNPIVVKDNFAGILMVGSLITAMLVNDIVLISTKMLVFTVRAVEKSLWLQKWKRKCWSWLLSTKCWHSKIAQIILLNSSTCWTWSSAKKKRCCILQTCCMGHVHVLLHVVRTHVEVVHIENHVEILDGISCWYTPWCSYSERSINHCWSHGWE